MIKGILLFIFVLLVLYGLLNKKEDTLEQAKIDKTIIKQKYEERKNNVNNLNKGKVAYGKKKKNNVNRINRKVE